MSLKSIRQQAGPFGFAIWKVVTDLVTIVNRLTSSTDPLTELLLWGRLREEGDVVPQTPALSGGAVPDTAENQAHVAALIAAVTLPTAAEVDAVSGGLLDAADKLNARKAVQGRAVLRFVGQYLADRAPANDV
jgi:hypothetical protein